MMINEQPPEKVDYRKDGSLDVVDIFSTIQGEGPYAGCPAVFVRLAGCDLQCPGCDTDYTTGRKRMGHKEVADAVRKHPNKGLVVLTGGEPFRQNIQLCARHLRRHGYDVQVETNGTLPIHILCYRAFDSIVCSPKTSKIHLTAPDYVDCWKYILDADHIAEDGLPTKSLGMNQPPARPPKNTSPFSIYIQPLDTGDNIQNKRNTWACAQVCERFGYRLSLQLHKYLEFP